MKSLVEETKVVSGIVPVNLAGGANDGDWVSLKNYRHLSVVVFKGAGGAAEPPTLTLEQATSVSGGSAKGLNFTTIYVNQRAALTADDAFTKVTQSAASTYAFGSGADGDLEAVAVVEINAEDLDVENGFDCVRARIADVGNTAQVGGVLYILSGPRYAPGLTAITN